MPRKLTLAQSSLADNFGLPSQPVLAASLDLGEVLSRVPESHGITPISRYPAVRQDLAVVVEETIPASEVQLHIEQAGGRLLRRVQLFDVYRGEQIAAGKKSLAYALTFQAPDRTLTDKDAAKVQGKIVKRLDRELGAKLRT